MISVNDMKNLIVPDQFGGDEDDYENASFNRIIDQIGEDIQYAYGASKFVIFPEEEDIVIKLPLNGEFHWNSDDDDYTEFTYLRNTNYCEDEEQIYFMAKKAGIEFFFAATECGGFTKNGVPFYVSTRILTEIAADVVVPSENSKSLAKKYRKEYSYCLPYHWLAEAIEYYGNNKVLQLINFVDKYKINDIHTGNVGYRADGAPCIFDYSGYYS